MSPAPHLLTAIPCASMMPHSPVHLLQLRIHHAEVAVEPIASARTALVVAMVVATAAVHNPRGSPSSAMHRSSVSVMCRLHHGGAADKPTASAEASPEHFVSVMCRLHHDGAADKPTASAGAVVVTTAAVHNCQGNLCQMVPEDPGPGPDYKTAYGTAPSHVSQRHRKWD